MSAPSGTYGNDVTMAPKTRHLAQGKRKRPNREPRISRAPREPSATTSPTLAAPVSQRTIPSVTGAEDRGGQPGAVKSTLRPDASRRPPGNRSGRPYQAGSRARATVGQEERRPNSLPRATEYAFIRSDMRRLLLTAGSLSILMILLLVLLDG